MALVLCDPEHFGPTAGRRVVFACRCPRETVEWASPASHSGDLGLETLGRAGHLVACLVPATCGLLSGLKTRRRLADNEGGNNGTAGRVEREWGVRRETISRLSAAEKGISAVRGVWRRARPQSGVGGRSTKRRRIVGLNVCRRPEARAPSRNFNDHQEGNGPPRESWCAFRAGLLGFWTKS